MRPSDPPPGDDAPLTRGPPAGLCSSCSHQRLIRNTRGSAFSMCDLSRSDAAYPRYPRLPVLSCTGHDPRPGGTPPPEGPR